MVWEIEENEVKSTKLATDKWGTGRYWEIAMEKPYTRAIIGSCEKSLKFPQGPMK